MSIVFGSHARERIRKPRTWTRETWKATLSGVKLTPKRGAWWKTFTPDADLVDEGKDTTSMLFANIGDSLIVFGADVDEIAVVEVTGVARDGVTLEIKTRYAPRAVRDGAVFVMRRSK
jgi:hypothetical protein